MSSQYYMEVRGCMTRFEPLTEKAVAHATEDGLRLTELSDALKRHGLSLEHVVHDPARTYVNTFYSDYEHGLYTMLCLNRQFMRDAAPTALQSLAAQGGMSRYLQARDWANYYYLDVPLPMMIYDFQRRYKEIPPDEIYQVWLAIHKRIDYSNGTWRPEVLDYVFSHAPATKLPTPDPDGMITLYRGMGKLSQPESEAVSWSTDPCNALWFAVHSGAGTHVAVARVRPEDIVSYSAEFFYENEVILRPGTKMDVYNEDMIPAVMPDVPALLAPTLAEFRRYGNLARQLEWYQEQSLHFHDVKHTLRVLLLSLIYYYNSGDQLTEVDKNILIHFSLLHDIGRNTEQVDEAHGDHAVEIIRKRSFILKGLALKKKDYHIAELLIRYHCRDDDVGAKAIAAEPGLTAKDKARAIWLYNICKDMDGLDRVRFHGLDYRLLRTPYARRLPLVAGCLLKEELIKFLDMDL